MERGLRAKSGAIDDYLQLTAKEIFKILDYKYDCYTYYDIKQTIVYSKKIQDKEVTVIFFLNEKRWMINCDYGNGVSGGIHASIDLFIAIQQQMRELEWIE